MLMEWGKINIVQMLAKEIFEFNVTPIKNLMSLFIELEKIPQMLIGVLRLQIIKGILGKKSTFWNTTTHDFKLHIRKMLAKQHVWYWYRNIPVQQREPRNKLTQPQIPDFYNGSKNRYSRKDSSFDK